MKRRRKRTEHLGYLNLFMGNTNQHDGHGEIQKTSRIVNNEEKNKR